MGRLGLLLLLLGPGSPAADGQLEPILARLAEEAAAFVRIAPLTLSEETLVQTTTPAPSLLRPQGSPARRPGAGSKSGPRRIVSEYGFTTFADSPNVLHEIRQVISVDGRPVRNRDSARLSLSLGTRSIDDRVKRRLLRELEEYGLSSAAVDLGQLILLFTAPHLKDYEFKLKDRGQAAAGGTLIVGFEQVGGEGSVTVFEGRSARRQPIAGEIWVRESDNLPLRVTIRTGRTQGQHQLRDEAWVDYAVSPHGTLLPSAVVHREYLDERLEVEDVASYAPFRKFAAETEIKFDAPAPEEAPR